MPTIYVEFGILPERNRAMYVEVPDGATPEEVDALVREGVLGRVGITYYRTPVVTTEWAVTDPATI